MTTSKQTQQTQSQSQTSPWAPTQPVLTGILSQIQNQLPNAAPTSQENQALANLTASAQSVPNYSSQAADATSGAFTGDPSGLLRPALSNLTNTLNPIAGASLDPTQTPGIQNLLSTIRSDISNSVNSQFAGAGRDLSGLNQQALARGIAQGEAQPLLNQYNQNVSNAIQAATGGFNATNSAANTIAGNQANAFNLASALPGIAGAPATGILSAQEAARALPLQNLGMLANLTVPIAGLGGQQSGSGYSQGSQTASPLSALIGIGSLFRPTGK